MSRKKGQKDKAPRKPRSKSDNFVGPMVTGEEYAFQMAGRSATEAPAHGQFTGRVLGPDDIPDGFDFSRSEAPLELSKIWDAKYGSKARKVRPAASSYEQTKSAADVVYDDALERVRWFADLDLVFRLDCDDTTLTEEQRLQAQKLVSSRRDLRELLPVESRFRYKKGHKVKQRTRKNARQDLARLFEVDGFSPKDARRIAWIKMRERYIRKQERATKISLSRSTHLATSRYQKLRSQRQVDTESVEEYLDKLAAERVVLAVELFPLSGLSAIVAELRCQLKGLKVATAQIDSPLVREVTLAELKALWIELIGIERNPFPYVIPSRKAYR